MRAHSIPAAVAILSLVVCNAVGAAEEKNPAKAIERANAALAAAIEKGDAKAVAGMYTETARVFPPGAEIVEGRAAIEEFWKASMATGIAGLELKSLDVEAFGDTIVETGTATVFGKGGTVIDKGKYVVVWKNVGGNWKLHRDCWNSSLPAPQR